MLPQALLTAAEPVLRGTRETPVDGRAEAQKPGAEGGFLDFFSSQESEFVFAGPDSDLPEPTRAANQPEFKQVEIPRAAELVVFEEADIEEVASDVTIDPKAPQQPAVPPAPEPQSAETPTLEPTEAVALTASATTLPTDVPEDPVPVNTPARRDAFQSPEPHDPLPTAETVPPQQAPKVDAPLSDLWDDPEAQSSQPLASSAPTLASVAQPTESRRGEAVEPARVAGTPSDVQREKPDAQPARAAPVTPISDSAAETRLPVQSAPAFTAPEAPARGRADDRGAPLTSTQTTTTAPLRPGPDVPQPEAFIAPKRPAEAEAPSDAPDRLSAPGPVPEPARVASAAASQLQPSPPPAIMAAPAEPLRLAEPILVSEPEIAPLQPLERAETAARVALAPIAPADATAGQRQAAQQIAAQIAQGLGDGAGREVEIRLEPEELGRVRIVMSAREGGYDVLVLAERNQTLEIMRRHTDELRNSFIDLGFEGSEFSFQQGHPDAQASGNSDTEPGAADVTGPGPFLAPQISERPNRITFGRLDLRV